MGKLPDGSQRALHKRMAGLSPSPEHIRPPCSRRRSAENSAVGGISNESSGNRVGADYAHRLRTASGQKEDALWKLLNLVILAGLTPPEWGISIVDENRWCADVRQLQRG